MKKFAFFANVPWYYLLGALLLIVLGVVIGRTTDTQPTQDKSAAQIAPAPAQPVVMAVEAVAPSVITVAEAIVANGVVAAKQTAQVSGHLTGVGIKKVLVDVGDVVRQGQVLAVLDDSALTDVLTQAGADLAQAQASHAKAKADLARVEPLLAMDAISRQEVDAYTVALQQAAANVVASQARLTTAQTNLKNAQITAPVSGVISQKHAQVGLLTSGAPLFDIIVDGQLEWQATIAPSQASQIQLGQSAQIHLDNRSITGRVIRLSPTANSAREVVVHVLLPSGAPLKVGMYQTGQFVLASQALPAVPVSALMSTDGYDYVWTLHAKEQDIYTVKRTKVQAGNRQGDQVVVDLPPEVLVVKQSGAFLSEGDLVRVVDVVLPTPVGQMQGE